MSRRALALALLLAALAACGGHGAPRFGGTAPSAEATYGSCAFCHHDLAANMTVTGGHHDLGLKCETCHEDLLPGQVGPGHRRVAACTECHSEQMTHHDPADLPPADPTERCLVCHTPHGSRNLFLVRERLMPSGVVAREVDITFTSLSGHAAGSFASVPAGTGICEVCHAGCPGGACVARASAPAPAAGSECSGGSLAGEPCTRFYRADATSDEHFPFSCLPCHAHAAGFAAQ